jgi:hypothetical protein
VIAAKVTDLATRMTDASELMRWACESATDAQLTMMAAELVREQTARDEAAQRFRDEQDAQEHAEGDA